MSNGRKVVCVHRVIGVGRLTLNKEYEVIEQDDGMFRVTDDRGVLTWFVAERFNYLAYSRNEVIDNILM